jgi:hypothetical protein
METVLALIGDIFLWIVWDICPTGLSKARPDALRHQVAAEHGPMQVLARIRACVDRQSRYVERRCFALGTPTRNAGPASKDHRSCPFA